MKKFHPLTVNAKQFETRDSVRLELDVPDNLRDEFDFLPGQHLPVQLEIEGKPLRRTYSICSRPGDWPLEIGIRVQPDGRFSEFAANELEVGDRIDVMPPFGQFHAAPKASQSRNYLGFAAGSGITPILSIISSILSVEAGSTFTLFYGNREQSTTMFIDDLYSLKNRYVDRLQLHFVFSREEQEFPIAAGRLDAAKVRELWNSFCRGMEVDEAFVCGPDSMIGDVTSALDELGVPPDRIHAERFGVPRKIERTERPTARAEGAAVTVVMDGHQKTFEMPDSEENIVDAAAARGIDLPYSCKGGVCATCRVFLRDGEVTMAANYGLEPWEVEAGFVLACQSRPVSRSLTLDYDKT